MDRIALWIAISLLAAPLSTAVGHQDSCAPIIKTYGNLTVEVYTTACQTLTPFYWKNGITKSGAEAWLRRLGVAPISILPGGFNTNLSGIREPVDYVEIEGKIINGRSGTGPILYEATRNGTVTYLAIAQGEVISWQKDGNQWRPVFRDLPARRRWAIASWPYIKVKHSTDTFIVQFFGDDASGEPWLEYVYRHKGNDLALMRKADRRKAWDYVEKRLIFDWTQRRAILISASGTIFAIVKGRADAVAIAKLAIRLGYPQAILMDGGSATAASARNPVYFAVIKK